MGVAYRWLPDHWGLAAEERRRPLLSMIGSQAYTPAASPNAEAPGSCRRFCCLCYALLLLLLKLLLLLFSVTEVGGGGTLPLLMQLLLQLLRLLLLLQLVRSTTQNVHMSPHHRWLHPAGPS